MNWRYVRGNWPLNEQNLLRSGLMAGEDEWVETQEGAVLIKVLPRNNVIPFNEAGKSQSGKPPAATSPDNAASSP